MIEDSGIGVMVEFLRSASAPFVELVAPLSGDSPAIPILRQRPGLYHVGFVVANLTEALIVPTMHRSTRLTEPIPAVAFDGRLVQFFLLRDGTIVELIADSQ